MGKNNRLIEQLKRTAREKQAQNVSLAASLITPQVYAAMAIALHRELGWGKTRINRLFVASQEIWESFDGRPSDMIEQCEKETDMYFIGENQYCCKNCSDYQHGICKCSSSSSFGQTRGKYDICDWFNIDRG